MALVTLARRDWIAVAEELDGARRADAPPGLRERIQTLLEATPAAWPDQACNLELADLAAVELVQAIVRQRQEQATNAGFVWQHEAVIAEAEKILRDHQDRRRLG